MKLQFALDQRQLSSVLALVQNICSRKTSLAVTSDIFFSINEASEVILRVTDLEICLQFVLPAFVTLKQEASFLVNAKRLYDFVRDLSDQVFFSFDGAKLFLNYGSGDTTNIDPNFHVSLLTSDPTSFPAFPERIENILNLDASFLQFALDKAASLVPQSSSNSAINGLLLDFDSTSAKFVATNGHSLVLVKSTAKTLSQPRSWTLPRKSVTELKKLVDTVLDFSINKGPIDLFLGVCNGYLVFSGENFTFFTRLVADAFPSYSSILSFQDFFKGNLSWKNLVPLLKRAGYLLDGKFISSNFDFSNARLKVSVSNPDCGAFSESVAFQPLGDFSVSANFYTPYILAAASVFEERDVDFYIKGPNSPLYFSAEIQDNSLLYLVMPVVDKN